MFSTLPWAKCVFLFTSLYCFSPLQMTCVFGFHTVQESKTILVVGEAQPRCLWCVGCNDPKEDTHIASGSRCFLLFFKHPNLQSRWIFQKAVWKGIRQEVFCLWKETSNFCPMAIGVQTFWFEWSSFFPSFSLLGWDRLPWHHPKSWSYLCSLPGSVGLH